MPSLPEAEAQGKGAAVGKREQGTAGPARHSKGGMHEGVKVDPYGDKSS